MKTVIDEFGKHLKKKGMRLTSERVRLIETILEIKGHFSSDQILTKIQVKKIPVSRATVYRLLPILIEADLIQQSLLSADGQTQFEVTWNKAHHDHLICTSCKKVIEFQHNTIEILQREIANKYGFVLNHHVMELMGRCRNCQKKLS